MFRIPSAAQPLAMAFEGAFTRPTFQRFVLLMTGLIVTIGRHTVSRALRVMEPVLGEGHWCNYYRLYSQARYRLWDVGLILTGTGDNPPPVQKIRAARHAHSAGTVHGNQPDLERTFPYDPCGVVEPDTLLPQAEHDLRGCIVFGASGNLVQRPTATSPSKAM